MFCLTKFCRICIKYSDKLIDIDSEDSDSIKISDKLLEICAKMVIRKEDHSKLCYECVQKLRISYSFYKQCAKSDRILERYMKERASVDPSSKIVNSELQITIVPVSRIQIKQESSNNKDENCSNSSTSNKGNIRNNNESSNSNSRTRVVVSSGGPTSTNYKPTRLRRRLKQEASFRISEAYKDRIRRLRRVCPRITKQQRCMLLKSLLTKSDNNSNLQNQNRKTRKFVYTRQKVQQSGSAIRTRVSKKKIEKKSKGGLRDLLGFTKNYDFGFSIDECDIKEECDSTVINRLESFSRTFFYSDFQDYRETILSLANDCESSDEDDMFAPYNEEEDRLLWPEFHISKNVQVKDEIDDDYDDQSDNASVKMEFVDEPIFESNLDIKEEPDYPQHTSQTEEENDGDLVPSELVQACYEDQPIERVAISHSLKQEINLGFQHFMKQIKTNLSSQSAAELSDPATIVNHINRISVIPEASTSANLSSLDLLTRLTNSTRLAKDAPLQATPVPTRCHLKCRTKGNPFINPELMQQFQMRTFKCNTCNRSFKSPGYLHSHCTKMGH